MRLDHLLSKEDERVDHALSEEVNSGSVLFNFEGSLKREYLEKRKRGFSSAGRAPALQAGGQGFDSLNLHQPRTSVSEEEDNRNWADSSAG